MTESQAKVIARHLRIERAAHGVLVVCSRKSHHSITVFRRLLDFQAAVVDRSLAAIHHLLQLGVRVQPHLVGRILQTAAHELQVTRFAQISQPAQRIALRGTVQRNDRRGRAYFVQNE